MGRTKRAVSEVHEGLRERERAKDTGLNIRDEKQSYNPSC